MVPCVFPSLHVARLTSVGGGRQLLEVLDSNTVHLYCLSPRQRFQSSQRHSANLKLIPLISPVSCYSCGVVCAGQSARENAPYLWGLPFLSAQKTLFQVLAIPHPRLLSYPTCAPLPHIQHYLAVFSISLSPSCFSPFPQEQDAKNLYITLSYLFLRQEASSNTITLLFSQFSINLIHMYHLLNSQLYNLQIHFQDYIVYQQERLYQTWLRTMQEKHSVPQTS